MKFSKGLVFLIAIATLGTFGLNGHGETINLKIGEIAFIDLVDGGMTYDWKFFCFPNTFSKGDRKEGRDVGMIHGD